MAGGFSKKTDFAEGIQSRQSQTELGLLPLFVFLSLLLPPCHTRSDKKARASPYAPLLVSTTTLGCCGRRIGCGHPNVPVRPASSSCSRSLCYHRWKAGIRRAQRLRRRRRCLRSRLLRQPIRKTARAEGGISERSRGGGGAP